ncbi:MAG: competence/damage-inducible protein A [Ignavibacteria bacterium]|nr:competence/damage-inducible protein A [Ignavibacteria bacterium]
MVNAKIISVGNELLIGQTTNSNATFISEKLYSINIEVKKIVAIGDNEVDLMEELIDSEKYYNITVITGGLGPTHDDITKSVLLKFFNDELVFNEKIYENIENLFKIRGIKTPSINKEQAMVPTKALIIWNRIGTAPGFCFEKDEKLYIALPGVPYEMEEMMNNSVVPMLTEKYSGGVGYIKKSKTFLTIGISESSLAEMIGNVEDIIGEHKLAFLPSLIGVKLRVDVSAETNEQISEILSKIESKLRNKIDEYIYGVDNDQLEKIVGNLLKLKNLKLATAESCTGGLLANKITDISGSSEYFLGGVNVYSNESKVNILGVNESTIRKYGAVSEETALEMAINVRELFKSDIGISITGIAGPDGGTDEKPVGLVYIGYSDNRKNFVKKFLLGHLRLRNKIRAAYHALDIIRKELTKE